ncbi:hypothetical protein DL762_008788 [Monosporascus cannonballus]|uniref:Uncharacterized protein n=1 Tax=Monosporascus cannonballus TaxID=155416 RepID=A0ABY0GVQ0_9PEZI|nr:hypothetical protein DL762_008788 [Monosporascus cannonballus]RYO83064.1 hypothetical protein DL763_008013 [Monosporascus cannonballus]
MASQRWSLEEEMGSSQPNASAVRGKDGEDSAFVSQDSGFIRDDTSEEIIVRDSPPPSSLLDEPQPDPVSSQLSQSQRKRSTKNSRRDSQKASQKRNSPKKPKKRKQRSRGLGLRMRWNAESTEVFMNLLSSYVAKNRFAIERPAVLKPVYENLAADMKLHDLYRAVFAKETATEEFIREAGNKSDLPDRGDVSDKSTTPEEDSDKTAKETKPFKAKAQNSKFDPDINTNLSDDGGINSQSTVPSSQTAETIPPSAKRQKTSKKKRSEDKIISMGFHGLSRVQGSKDVEKASYSVPYIMRKSPDQLRISALPPFFEDILLSPRSIPSYSGEHVLRDEAFAIPPSALPALRDEGVDFD